MVISIFNCHIRNDLFRELVYITVERLLGIMARQKVHKNSDNLTSYTSHLIFRGYPVSSRWTTRVNRSCMRRPSSPSLRKLVQRRLMAKKLRFLNKKMYLKWASIRECATERYLRSVVNFCCFISYVRNGFYELRARCTLK